MSIFAKLKASLYITSIALYLTVSLIPWTLSIVLPPRLRYKVNSQIAYFLWLNMQKVFEQQKKANVTFSGDDVPIGENALVICNHVSWSDYYMVHALALRKRMLPYQRYFAKFSLGFIPILGWSMLLVGMVMLRRNFTTDRLSLIKTFASLKKQKNPMWLVTYVEGTRVTPRKLLESQRYCRKVNAPFIPHHVLYPRTKGFAATIEGLKDSHIKYVYDLTIAYKKGDKLQIAPSPLEVHEVDNLNAYKFHVHVRRFPISDISNAEEWLIQRWAEKDKILEGLSNEWTDSRLLQ